MTTSFFDDVYSFHEAFRLSRSHSVSLPVVEEQSLRRRLIEEEYGELNVGINNKDVVAIAKESADLIYVVCGLNVSYGIPLNEVWDEVHRSNMHKLGPNGLPIYRDDGKVMKPKGWKPPNIRAILEAH